MKENFLEETVICKDYKRENFKYNLINTFAIISFSLILIWFLVCFNTLVYPEGHMLSAIIMLIIPCIIFYLIGYFLMKLKYKFCVDYDYVLVEGSVRISKVVKNRRRFNLIEFDAKKVTKLGLVNSDDFIRVCSDKDLKVLFATSNNDPTDGKDFYYLVTVSNSIKYIVVLECTKKFLLNLLACCHKGVKDATIK
jgi:hypothetical protein